MSSNPVSRWEIVAVVIGVLIFSLAAIENVPGLKDPMGDWLSLMSGSLYIAAAHRNSMERSHNKRLTISYLLIGAYAMLRLYTRTISASSVVVTTLDWVAIALMFAGVVLLFLSRPKTHGK